MAKQKLVAGAELDLLTRDELAGVLESWRNELTRGARIRRLSIQGNADGAGALSMGLATDGPSESVAWGITRFSVAPGPTLGANGLAVYVNSVESPSNCIISKLTTDLFPDARGCCLMPGNSLRITGTGITANAQVTVTMSIREVPVQMAWSL